MTRASGNVEAISTALLIVRVCEKDASNDPFRDSPMSRTGADIEDGRLSSVFHRKDLGNNVCSLLGIQVSLAQAPDLVLHGKALHVVDRIIILRHSKVMCDLTFLSSLSTGNVYTCKEFHEVKLI